MPPERNGGNVLSQREKRNRTKGSFLCKNRLECWYYKAGSYLYSHKPTLNLPINAIIIPNHDLVTRTEILHLQRL